MTNNKFTKAALAVGLVLATAIGLFAPSRSAEAAGGILGPWQTILQSGQNGWTNSLTGTLAASNTVTAYNGTGVDLSTAKEVQIQWTSISDRADAATKGIALARNVDGSTNMEVFLRWNVTGNGNNWITSCTNLTMNSLGGVPAHLYVLYVTNDSAASINLTNYYIRVNTR